MQWKVLGLALLLVVLAGSELNAQAAGALEYEKRGVPAKTMAGVPRILDCSYDDEWNDFRELFRENAAQGFPFEDSVFQKADRLIAKNILTFLEFHRSKSNAFFHDCDREEPEGMVCLYGMLSALFVHHLYLLRSFQSNEASDDEREVFNLSTNLARLMVINKNNCLDFFDSSNWPLTLAQLVATLRPPAVDDESLLLDPLPEHRPAPWQVPRFAAAAAAVAANAPSSQQHIIAYITGTHAALAREPAEMLSRFAGPLLGFSLATVMEVADDTHCGYLGCSTSADTEAELLPSIGLTGYRFRPVGLGELARHHFRPRWNGLDIVDLKGMAAEFQRRFAEHALSRSVDIVVCTSPAVLCSLLVPFQRPLIAYLGEPLLLSVDGDDRVEWFEQFDALATSPHHYFTCYNPFLSSMIEYQTGLVLPVIRLHGLYTEATYAAGGSRGGEVLVVKGPNICADSVCVLNRFVKNLLGPQEEPAQGEFSKQTKFVGLDELGGAPYPVLAAFRATVLYPYDVALAIFYELYSMGMPLLMPHRKLLPFYVFRGLHSHRDYHHVREDPKSESGTHFPGAGVGSPPFVPPLEHQRWFHVGSAWSARTDFHGFPHILRFGNAAELLALLAPGATDWSAISSGMHRFNQETLAQSSTSWAHGVAAVLSGQAGAERAVPVPEEH